MNKTITAVLATLVGSLALAQGSVPALRTNMNGHDMNSLSASMTPGMDTKSATSALGNLAKLSGRSFDRAFLSMMIPHHMAAVAMARAVLPLSEDDRVKGWATGIIQSQRAEIMTMTALLKAYGGPNVTQRNLMRNGMGSMADRVRTARNPDLTFVQGMLPHHSSAIDMAKLALENSTNVQILGLARDIIVAQAGEMYEFQRWLSRR